MIQDGARLNLCSNHEQNYASGEPHLPLFVPTNIMHPGLAWANRSLLSHRSQPSRTRQQYYPAGRRDRARRRTYRQPYPPRWHAPPLLPPRRLKRSARTFWIAGEVRVQRAFDSGNTNRRARRQKSRSRIRLRTDLQQPVSQGIERR